MSAVMVLSASNLPRIAGTSKLPATIKTALGTNSSRVYFGPVFPRGIDAEDDTGLGQSLSSYLESTVEKHKVDRLTGHHPRPGALTMDGHQQNGRLTLKVSLRLSVVGSQGSYFLQGRALSAFVNPQLESLHQTIVLANMKGSAELENRRGAAPAPSTTQASCSSSKEKGTRKSLKVPRYGAATLTQSNKDPTGRGAEGPQSIAYDCVPSTDRLSRGGPHPARFDIRPFANTYDKVSLLQGASGWYLSTELRYDMVTTDGEMLALLDGLASLKQNVAWIFEILEYKKNMPTITKHFHRMSIDTALSSTELLP